MNTKIFPSWAAYLSGDWWTQTARDEFAELFLHFAIEVHNLHVATSHTTFAHVSLGHRVERGKFD